MDSKFEEAKKGKVLFVDDEVNIQKLFIANFNNEFDIQTASNGKEGLELARRQEFDIVVSDQRMPLLTGIEFLKELRAINPHQERIILTGYTEYDVVVRAINECGIYHFFTKPWDYNALKLCLVSAAEKVSFRKRNDSLIQALIQANEALERASRNIENNFLESINRLNALEQGSEIMKEERPAKDKDLEELSLLNKKLLAFSLRLNQKKKVLEQVKSHLSTLPIDMKDKTEIRKVVSMIDGQLKFENEWENFETYFNAIKPEFIQGLKLNYSDLSQHELKLCALISMNISTKNLSLVLNVSKESVSTARYRLRQKLGLDKEEKLDDFLIMYGRS